MLSLRQALEQFGEWVKENHAQQPSFGAQLNALGREAVKDVRNSLHQAFYGQAEHFPEPGTPLNPTPQLITADLTGQSVNMDMPTINVHQVEHRLDMEMER